MQPCDQAYLRHSVQVEPLIDQWYAWSHLIPPATAARNTTERHLKIMESFVNAPGVHVAAVKNPAMLGGPFIDHAPSKVGEIRELRNRTIRERADLVMLSSALDRLSALLRSAARGTSLQPLYEEVPAELRGYVELVYDLESHPSYRLIEPLLYRSPFYKPEAQSLMLSEITNDARPFVLSTPRLEAPDVLHLRMPFAARAVDDLFALKTTPQIWGQVREWLELGGESAVHDTLFTSDAPPRYVPYSGNGVRWRYFGHACILIETRWCSILFDPVLSYTYESDIARYTYQDLPDRIDYVVVTHNHQDHVLFETLLQIRHKTGCVVVPRSGGGSLQDPSLKLTLEAAGFSNVVELAEFESCRTGEIEIMGLPFFGEHADLDIRSKLAYLVRTPRHRMMFAADSCNVEPALYTHISREVGPVDVLFVGMECDGAPLTWLYGPLLTKPMERAADQSRRLAGSDCRQAMHIVKQLGCSSVYVYAMGQEPWLNHVMSIKYTEQSRPIRESNELIRQCVTQGIVAERLFGEKEILCES